MGAIAKPKKHWGQNFLRNQETVSRIIETAGVSAESRVLEVGPGEGALTERLLAKAGRLISVEIDPALSAFLAEKFGRDPKFSLVREDILKVNLPSLIRKSFGDHPYKVVANIPYYVTSPIIRLFLETETRPEELVLMVQKEVAERIVAVPGHMSLLALSVQHYAVPELLFPVGKENFFPVPEVDSAIIKIRLKDGAPSAKESKPFFRIAKAGFSSKRKTLLNNLSSGLHLDRAETEERLAESGIDPRRRAQELELEEWQALAERFL